MAAGTELLLRVTSSGGPRPPQGWQRDVIVTLAHQHTIDDLCTQLAGEFGVPIQALSTDRLGVLDPTRGVLATGLLSGDEVVAHAEPSRPGNAQAADVGASDGTLGFQRTPYRAVVVPAGGEHRISGFPAEPERRRLQFWSMLAPLMAGLALFAFSRQPQFLLLTVISPIAMAAQAIDDRRSGRRRHSARVADFRVQLARRVAELEGIHREQLALRLQAAPDVATLALRAEHRAVDLWERGRDASDVLVLRVGSGAVASGLQIAVDQHGPEELRREALDAVAGLDRHAHAPVVVDMTRSIVAVHGESSGVDRLTAALVIQAACLHSPNDLAVLAAVPPTRRMGWLQWLPHLRDPSRPVAEALVVTDDPDPDLLTALVELIARRRASERRWPFVLAVLDATVCADSILVAQLLESARHHGVGVVWLAHELRQVPHGVDAVIDVGTVAGANARMWTRHGGPAVEFEPEQIGWRQAEHAARALCPLRDVTASGPAGTIPDVVGLWAALQSDDIDADWVLRRWAQDRLQHRLPVVLGHGGGGSVVGFDFVADGPHVLIGGTSGAGKSELLQSLVMSAASVRDPSRLNFLFVDFKGGAAFKVFEGLPHAAGYVTNLDGALADRVLVSLRAELRRRMQLLEGYAKDLTDMVRVAPTLAPPALVIVIDEFATLIKEVPGFVAGIVDVAQRGRSLGIHLVLATQRPTGSINDDIAANVSIRIALRVLDPSDSRAIVGSAEAVEIPVARRGRAIMRIGSGGCVQFQTAHGGEPAASAMCDPVPLVRNLHGVGQFDPPTVGEQTEGVGTQLAAVLEAIVDAGRRTNSEANSQPVWCPPLPETVTLEQLQPAGRADQSDAVDAGRALIGLVDEPEHQRQQALYVDLDEVGGIAVYGAAGAGKSMALKCVVASLTAGNQPVAVFAFDCGWHGLADLRRARHVVDVVAGDDPEAITRTIIVLEHELARRLSVSSMGTVVDQRIVVVVDGWGALADALGEHPSAPQLGDSWIERLVRVITDGRRFGIHAVLTCDRRSALPARLQAVLGGQLVLRLSDPNQYPEHGLAMVRALGDTLPPGRGWWGGSLAIQVADARACIQDTEQRFGDHPMLSYPLPSKVSTPLVRCDRLNVPFGVVDVSSSPAVLDLEWSHAVVAGGRRSGRSTALSTIVHQLAGGTETLVCGAPGCGVVGAATGTDQIGTHLDRLIAKIDNARLLQLALDPIVLIVDDADQLDDPGLLARFGAVLGSAAVRLVGSVETRSLVAFNSSPLVGELKRARRIIALQPDDPHEWIQVAGIKLAPRHGLRLPPGRGALIADRRPTWVQVGSDDATDVQVFDRVVHSEV